MFNFVAMKHFPARLTNFTMALLIFSALGVFTVVSRAEIVAAESFDYDTPTIRGCNGGVGWADAWTGDNIITRGSFHYADYDSTGNRLITLGDSSGKSDAIKCSFRTLAVTGRDHLVIE